MVEKKLPETHVLVNVILRLTDHPEVAHALFTEEAPECCPQRSFFPAHQPLRPRSCDLQMMMFEKDSSTDDKVKKTAPRTTPEENVISRRLACKSEAEVEQTVR